MKFVNIKILIPITVIVVIGIIIAISLASCDLSSQFSSIADIIHEDTQYTAERKFSDEKLSEYKINGILFAPYSKQLPHKSDYDGWYRYFLRLAVYKSPEYKASVTINSIKIEGLKDVKFEPIAETFNENVEFDERIDFDSENNLERGIFELIEKINDYDMEITKDSQWKVVLNVTVEDEENTITQDLTYIFNSRIRTYFIPLSQ